LLIQHLAWVIVARNRTVDQRQQLRAQRGQDEILAITALVFGARFDKAALEQQRFIIRSRLLERVQIAGGLARRGLLGRFLLGVFARGEAALVQLRRRASLA
jgi:hypothetical protein